MSRHECPSLCQKTKPNQDNGTALKHSKEGFKFPVICFCHGEFLAPWESMLQLTLCFCLPDMFIHKGWYTLCLVFLICFLDIFCIKTHISPNKMIKKMLLLIITYKILGWFFFRVYNAVLNFLKEEASLSIWFLMDPL